MTKLDAIFPSCRGAKKYSDLPKEAKDFIKEVEDKTGVPIVLIGTGPEAMEINRPQKIATFIFLTSDSSF